MKSLRSARLSPTGRRSLTGILSIALLPLLFGVDRLLPLGVAAGVLYVIPVLLTFRSSGRVTLAVTITASLLVLAEPLLAQPEVLGWMALLNRALSLLVIWVTAALVHLGQRAARTLSAARAGLEHKVAERTAHLDDLNRRLAHEIAERHHVEQALRESTERFRAMVEVTSDWVWEIDVEHRYIYSSPKVADLLGYSPHEIIGRTPFELMPPLEAERVARLFAEIAATHRPMQCMENLNQHRDGRLVTLETSAVPMFDTAGAFRGYRGIDRDITERKAAERGLLASERGLRQIIDLVPHRIFVKDADSRFVLANRAVGDAYGVPVEAILGRRQQEIHGTRQETERMLNDDRSVIEQGETKLIPEERFTNAGGETRILRTVKIPYELPDGRGQAVLGMAIDITEEKDYERRLQASEQKYRALLENAVDAIILAELDGRLVDANRRAEQLLGYSRDELQRMRAADLHPVEEHPRLQEVFQALRGGGPTLVVHPVLRKGGELLRCEVAASLIQFGEQYVVQGIFRDVSPRERRAEQRLEQEKRHRDTLVREVHHRIKNNLQGVVGLLREHANAHSELTDLISAAIGQVQSISVVHGLHGQGDDLQVRLCDMVQAIARNASTLTRTQVEPEVHLAVTRPVLVDKDEAVPVALIINELILNAVKHRGDASGAQGILVRLTQDETSAEVCVVNPGNLPAGFEFARGRGGGTGLGLVRSLLPHAGASLSFEQAQRQVTARLHLGPPVVTF